MTRARVLLVVAAAVAGLGSAACGDDTSVNPADAGKDGSQLDGSMTDGSPSNDGKAPGDGAADSGDGGPCDFATFVTGLIQSHTNSTDPPSTDLGQKCTDKMDQSQFKPLFP